MPITINLHRFEGCETSLCTETLEELEDKLKLFLINECFDDFTIEDSYTGNELSSCIDPEDIGPGDVSYDGEGFVEQEELDAIQRPGPQAQVDCQITLEHIQARFASPATPADIQKAVQAFKDGFKEWEASE